MWCVQCCKFIGSCEGVPLCTLCFVKAMEQRAKRKLAVDLFLLEVECNLMTLCKV
jgi:hypothetical protein